MDRSDRPTATPTTLKSGLGSIPTSCESCHESFATADLLEAHLLTHLPGIERDSCNEAVLAAHRQAHKDGEHPIPPPGSGDESDFATLRPQLGLNAAIKSELAEVKVELKSLNVRLEEVVAELKELEKE